MAERRSGKPYIWVTWLAGVLGGNKCWWAAWFKAHFSYQKYETMGGDLVKWSKQHDEMVLQRKALMEENGWTVGLEEANAFKLEGNTATLAGKPDLCATMHDETLVEDGKTGRPRDSDWWQVVLYLFALPKCRKDLPAKINGQLYYRQGDKTDRVPGNDVNARTTAKILEAIAIVAGEKPPARKPSEGECRKCNIGPADCPDRYVPKKAAEARTDDF